MFGINRAVIAQNERALRIRDGAVEDILTPGVYRYWDLLGRVRLERFRLEDQRFEHVLVDSMLSKQRDLFDRYFDLVEAGQAEIALVYMRNALYDIVLPGDRSVYWSEPNRITVARVDLSESLTVSDAVLRQIRASQLTRIIRARTQLLTEITVDDGETGLLFVDGKLVEQLPAGSYGFWKVDRPVRVKVVEQRRQAMEVSGQEILTKDKVSLRINLAATYRIVDPVKAVTADGDFVASLYRELQFALRQAISADTLDVLLSNKSNLDNQVFESARTQTDAFGVVLESVGVKDIILPGDMKDLMNQVVEAEKAAQANVIKRREETAATRSLLNTAKLMADNPTLMRLKELEALEKVVEKVERLTVYNGLEGILSDTVKIGPKDLVNGPK